MSRPGWLNSRLWDLRNHEPCSAPPKTKHGGASSLAPPCLLTGNELPQSNVPNQHSADYVRIFYPLVIDLLLGGRVAILLHVDAIDLVGEAIQGSHVSEDEGVADVPIVRAGALGVQKHVEGDKQPGAPFRLPDGDDVAPEVVP